MNKMPPRIKARIGARLLLLQARWDPARMQGTGLSFALDPWLSICWAAEPEGLRAARLRHLEYFNTHPIAAWLVAGIICRHEAAAAAQRGPERETLLEKICALKTKFGASLAGIYDSFFWGALRPASAIAGILVAQVAYRAGWAHPLAAAVATSLVFYNGPALAARWLGWTRGLERGDQAVAELSSLSIQSWIGGLRRAAACGAVLSFALAAAEPGMFLEPDSLKFLPAACLVFAAGLVLSRRGVAPLTQLGLSALVGMVVYAVRIAVAGPPRG